MTNPFRFLGELNAASKITFSHNLIEKLVNMEYDFDLSAMSSIGYKQIGRFLKGELALATAIQQIKFETHRFVRHQYNWFQLKDDRIHWVDILNRAEPEITTLLTRFIGGE